MPDRLAFDHDPVVACVDQIYAGFESLEEPGPLFERLLALFIELTRSACGFIGHVEWQDGQPVLVSRAVSDLSWDEDSHRLWEQSRGQGMVFRNLDTLFGQVLRTQQTFFTNAAAGSPHAGGVPRGHPPIHSFLGIPVRLGGRMLGMVGLANAPLGYGPQHERALSPLLLATGQLLHGMRLREELERATVQARRREEGLTLVTRWAREFLTTGASELDAAIHLALAEVGRFVEADRAYIFSVDVDEGLIDNSHEWCAEGIEPMIQMLQRLPIREYGGLMNPLLEARTLAILDVPGLPDSWVKERESLLAQGIRSLVLVPTTTRGVLTGIIGFDAVRGHRVWSQADVAILEGLGNSLGHVLERMGLERRVRATEAYAQTLGAMTEDVVFVRETSPPSVVYVNAAFEKLTGLPLSMVMEDPEGYLRAVHPEDRDRVMAAFASQDQHPCSQTYRVLRPDGEVRWVHDRTFPLPDNDGRLSRVVGIAQDVTDRVARDELLQSARVRLEERVAARTIELAEANAGLQAEVAQRRQAEEQLRESEERFRTLAEASGVALFVLQDDVVTYANEAACLLLDRPLEDLRGRRYQEIEPTLLSEPRPYRRGASEQSPRFTEVELRVRTPAGRVRDLHLVYTPVPWGERLAVLATAVDLTERKRAENLIRLRLDDLAGVSRALVLSQLSASLAHELNQPLAAISNFVHGTRSRLQRASPAPSADLIATVERTAEEARRAGEIVQRIRALFEPGRRRRMPLQPHLLAASVARLMRSDLNANERELVLQGPPHLRVFADGQELELALVNLVSNAIHATLSAPPGTRLVLDWRGTPECTVVFRVADPGPKVPAEDLPLLFDPFFTTRDEGTGMGLSMVRAVAEAHGGKAWYEDDGPLGKAFALCVPERGDLPEGGERAGRREP